MKEEPLRKKTPVDCPFKEKLSSQVKGTCDVTNWISEEKWCSKEKLNHSTEKEKR